VQVLWFKGLAGYSADHLEMIFALVLQHDEHKDSACPFFFRREELDLNQTYKEEILCFASSI
jgi:hypothetical protein